MIRRIGSLASMALLAAGVSAGQSRGKMVSFGSAPETVSGYLAAPEEGGKKPGLVIIQEWWGVDDFVKGKADHFASLGYVALAPDLYRGKVATDSDTAHQLMMGLDPERALRDLRAAIATLAARPDVDAARIGSVGWCMGGGYSLRLALAEPRLAAAAIYYGRLVTDEKQIAALRAPLLGNFGGKDQGPDPETVREFERKTKAPARAWTSRSTRRQDTPSPRRRIPRSSARKMRGMRTGGRRSFFARKLKGRSSRVAGF